jgi:lipopolysaccharide/colanic/teichoic acid biosynthesis glycosyltransferase
VALEKHAIDLVVISPEIRTNSVYEHDLYNLLFTGVEIIDLAAFYEVITGRVPPFIFSEGWFLEHLHLADNPIYDRLRTIMDYGAAVIVGLIGIFLFPFIALAIKLNSPGPIFFHQKRVGKSGVEFTLYKFRSMYALAPDGSAEVNGAQFATKNDTRITAVGRFLRKTRMDELPQIWNILKRDLTLVGPRPERPEITRELEHRIHYYPLRHVVRPGITGWAQIHQNYTDNFESTEEKLQYDFYYIKNKSLLLDIIILLRTVNVVLRFRGQ